MSMTPDERVCARPGCHAGRMPQPLRRFLSKTGRETRACDRCRVKGRDATAAIRRRHRPDPAVAEAERLLGVARAARGRAARALLRAVHAVDKARRHVVRERGVWVAMVLQGPAGDMDPGIDYGEGPE